MNSTHKEHPSYAQIVLTKPSWSGKGRHLFGSKVRHPRYISMEINEAIISEDGTSERVFGRKSIVKISMSEAQWAHMISSFSDGAGTPVTLDWRVGVGRIENPPEPEQILDMAKDDATKTKGSLVARLNELRNDVTKLSEKSGTISKKDLKQLALDFNILASWLDGNFDFLEERVKSRMEKAVADANIEIEALINNAVTRLGQRALGEKLAAGESIEVLGLTGGDDGKTA